jgi:hypothetical protein
VEDISAGDAVSRTDSERDRPLDEHDDGHPTRSARVSGHTPHAGVQPVDRRYEIFLGLATEKRS